MFHTITVNHLYQRFIKVGLVLLSLWLLWPVEVKAYKANYESMHTAKRIELAKAGTVSGWRYLLDPHIWVYTSAFAQRFGMPERWVDDSLEGVEAISFKIIQDNHQFCGYGGNPSACAPVQACLFDFYIPKTANLPWKDDSPKGFHSGAGFRSTRFLMPQDEKNSLNYDEDFDWNTNGFAFTVGFDYVRMVRDYNKLANSVMKGMEVILREFDRTFNYFKNSKKIGLQFLEPMVVDGKPGPYYKKYGTDIPIRHLATIPNTFMNQAIDYKKQGYEEHLLNLIQGGFQSTQ